jgi:hypothetical protein
MISVEHAHVVAAERRAHEQIGRLFAGVSQQLVQFLCNLGAGAGHRSPVARSIAGTIVRTDPRQPREFRLYVLPFDEHIAESGVEDHCRAAGAGTVELEPISSYIDQAARFRVAARIDPGADCLI